MSTQTETGIDTRLFLGGEFVEADGGRTFENRDPFTGEVVSEVAAGTRADAKRAVEAAAAAFGEWSRTPPAVRQGIFLEAADVLESRQDEVVSTRETGCTFGFGMFQMHFVPGLFRQAAALAYAPLGEVIPSDSDDEAVERANATPYGLSSGIITSDADRGLALAQSIDAGIVHVNDQPVGDEPQMPFGGVKDSGFGRFGGTAVVDEFTEMRWITAQRGAHPFPF